MNQKGFSLIEILIGVAILSAMALLINVVTKRILDSQNRVGARDELLHSARMSLDKLTEDLGCAFLTNASLEGQNSAYETGMTGTETEINFSTLCHLHYQKDAKDTDQISVGYRLASSEGGFSNLHRRESQRLGEKINEGGWEGILLSHVKELRLSYYDNNKEEWVKDWDTTKVSHLNRLPEAVKIELVVVEAGNEENEKELREHHLTTTALIDLHRNEISF